VSGSAPRSRDERAADPEALLLFTFEIGRADLRLFDEVLDRLALNEPHISVHRLRNLCRTPTDRALVDAALSWAMRTRAAHAARPRRAAPKNRSRCFRRFGCRPGNLTQHSRTMGSPDHRWSARGKSRPPRLHDPIAFALRLRRLLGQSARAEVIRALLTIRAPRLSSKVITASAGFAQRNVREALTQLFEAGVLTRVDIADERFYTIDDTVWAAVFGFAGSTRSPVPRGLDPDIPRARGGGALDPTSRVGFSSHRTTKAPLCRAFVRSGRQDLNLRPGGRAPIQPERTGYVGSRALV
jgi:hypothetical protein